MMDLLNSFPILAFSWVIQSPYFFTKKMDKSVFLYSNTGIPREIRGFFGAQDIKLKEKKEIIFKHKENFYKAYIECTSSNKARIIWHRDFSSVINNELSQWARYFRIFKEAEEIYPEMQLIREEENLYNIQFIDYAFAWVDGIPMTIKEKEIERFDFEEFFDNKIGRKIDYIEKAKFNSMIGFLGEHYVLEYEKNCLRKDNRDDLARRVEHVSETKGDGLGFDILSFERDGNPKFIEVKTSVNHNEMFYISPDELKFSKDYSCYSYLYRLTNFDWNNKFGEILISHGNLYGLLQLNPVMYQGKFIK